MDTPASATTAVTVGAILNRYERDCLDELAPRTQTIATLRGQRRPAA